MRLCSRNPTDGDADIRNNAAYTHLILDSAQKRKTNNSKSVNISMVDLGLGCRSVDIFESKNYENIMQITRKFVREVSTRVRIIFSSGTMRITICWQTHTHTQHTRQWLHDNKMEYIEIGWLSVEFTEPIEFAGKLFWIEFALWNDEMVFLLVVRKLWVLWWKAPVA